MRLVHDVWHSFDSQVSLVLLRKPTRRSRALAGGGYQSTLGYSIPTLFTAEPEYLPITVTRSVIDETDIRICLPGQRNTIRAQFLRLTLSKPWGH